MSLETYRSIVDRKLVRLAIVRDRVKHERASLRVLEHQAVAIEHAQTIAQTVAAEVQNKVHEKLAEIVSQCLEAVFDEPYTFVIRFERKRGRTEARLVFERDGLEVDPLTASGGGVVDVASMALRIGALLLSRPPVRRLLVLDEPFRFVSPDLRGRVRFLLESLAIELKIQIIMVTHDVQIEAGRVVRLP